MEGKKSEDNLVNQHLTENVLSRNNALLENLPNLSHRDCELVVNYTKDFQLTKKRYLGLAFPLNDDRHINQLKDLSNEYFEPINGTVKMGVTKLENSQEILQAPYPKPSSLQIVK